MASKFSRLQLAAALLEYDNDSEDPAVPYRSAHESAIFAHLRRNQAIRPPVTSRRSADFLGVSIPSEGSIGARESVMGNRVSRGSIDALQNPFGGTVEDEEAEEDNGIEVDLTSWGLDAFIPKEKGSTNSRNRAKSDTLPNPHPVPSLRQPSDDVFIRGRRPAGTRSMSLGNLDQLGAGGAFLEAKSSSLGPDERTRRSIASPLELAGMQQHDFHRHRISSHALIETLPSALPLHSIPFPTGSIRSSSPPPNEDGVPSSRLSEYSRSDLISRPHGRTYSTASLGSRMLLGESEQHLSTIRGSSPDRTSRLDSNDKEKRTRTMSDASMGTMASKFLVDDNPFSLRPPSPSRSSKFDPKMAVHARNMSTASFGSQMLLENDAASQFTAHGRPRDRPLSTIELLRPKVLVMPSPLQSATPPPPPAPTIAPDGFQLSADGPPLPPGARTARRSSVTLSILDPSVPVPSNSFTPNPRMSLSLSQLTFRNNLMVGGQRDVAYSDIDQGLPRATEDGEQIHPPAIIEEPKEELAPPELEVVDQPPKPGRLAGKLYGKSLIDDLENRKAEMRNKQRVFRGDERPSMMARSQLKRSSTLIDQASLQQRPVSQLIESSRSHNSQQSLARRNSTLKPLINLDGPEKTGTLLSPGIGMGAPRSRSVFGVDTLWEREMAKLKEIEVQERLAAEERQKQEVVEAQRKRKGRGKGNAKPKAQEEVFASPLPPTVESRVSSEPPILPAIPKATTRGPPPPIDNNDTESDSDETSPEHPSRSHDVGDAETGRWFAGASDEDDDGPRRTTGRGLRYPNQSLRVSHPMGEDSEEDLPLAATIGRAAERAIRIGLAPDDSDEEKPLSTLVKTKLSLPFIQFDHISASKSPSAGDDNDDDEPLGLRASKIIPSSQPSNLNAGDDDDRPLALHPEQQRRTQYQMMAQQQIMMQAQMQSSIFFANPSMMGSGFFAPPIPPSMIMAPPVPMPSPSPLPDSVKYGRVDRWRRDVAVEGEH